MIDNLAQAALCYVMNPVWTVDEIKNELCKRAAGPSKWRRVSQVETPAGIVQKFEYGNSLRDNSELDHAFVTETPTGLQIQYNFMSGGEFKQSSSEVTRKSVVTPTAAKPRTPEEKKLDIALRKACYVAKPKAHDRIASLLAQGADPNAKSHADSFGFDKTALSEQLYVAYPPTTKLLLDHGADVNWINNNGGTILHTFLDNRYDKRPFETFKMLLNAGFNHFDHLDAKGTTLRQRIVDSKAIDAPDEFLAAFDAARARSMKPSTPPAAMDF